MIYLPEQTNYDDASSVTLIVNYTYNGDTQVRSIEFRKDGNGDRFDVIRNHSYIFNITSVGVEFGGIICSVEKWEPKHPDLEI